MVETDIHPPALKADTSFLIILMGSLGDVVRGLCIVSHLKGHLPDSSISWLVEPKWAQLVGLHRQIDRVIVFNRPRHVLGVGQLYRELSRHNFDITLDLQRHFKSGFFSLLSGAKRRIGFHRQNAKEFNWLFNNEHIASVSNENEFPKWRHYLKFAEYLGCPAPLALDFGITAQDSRIKLPKPITQVDGPYIAVVMGSSWETKDWFFDKYYQLVKNLLVSGDQTVVLVGDHSKTVEAAELCQKIGPGRLINLVGKTSLLEVVAVLAAAAAGVGPDSGPAHLSAALGTPFVTIFGPTPPIRTAPYKCDHLVVQSELSCMPCYKKECPDLDRQCMRTVAVEMVEKKISEALAMGTIR